MASGAIGGKEKTGCRPWKTRRLGRKGNTMGWETRNGRGRYFTRSRKEHGRVKRVYYGTGQVGDLAATFFAQEQVECRQAHLQRQEEQARWQTALKRSKNWIACRVYWCRRCFWRTATTSTAVAGGDDAMGNEKAPQPENNSQEIQHLAEPGEAGPAGGRARCCPSCGSSWTATLPCGRRVAI